MFKIQKKDGFASFLEVVISAMIFIIAGFGIFTAISTLTPQEKDSDNRLKAALIGKEILDTIYRNIDTSSWDDTSCPYGLSCDSGTITHGDYTIKKTVTSLGPPTNLKKVTLTITYPE